MEIGLVSLLSTVKDGGMKNLGMTFVGALGCLFAQSAMAAEDFEVKPVGFQIVWDTMREEFDGFGTMNAMESGVKLSFAATTTGKSIVKFDGDGCKLTKFSDNAGKAMKGEVGHFAKVGESGKTLRFEIESKELPTKGATGFELEGSLVVDVASKSDVVKSQPAEFAKGEALAFGEILKTKITEIGEPGYGDMKAEITLEAKKAWPAFSAVRFYDGEGNEIESKSGGHSRFSMLGSVTESRTFRLATKPEKFHVEMDVWSDKESITVPFSVKAGLGL